MAKNVDPLRKLSEAERTKLRAGRGGGSTFDNRTTWSHVDYLARVNAVLPDERYRKAVQRGIDYILKEQHESGG